MPSPLRALRAMAHPRVRKARRGRRRTGILWDYNGDGRYPTEWLSPWWRRYWRRWARRLSHHVPWSDY